ncbi:MAG: bifunctional aldolase/short-chain dehydrogenase [Magnetococcales bacterium]|nr:bifunctional aldolase/short-chain dehydrogenase [Magnetococcales bacterium]
MKNLWSEQEAAASRQKWAEGSQSALALRIYSSHLLGQNPSLVLHGGGNCSLKSQQTDLLGRQVPALFVKASGHDMGHLTLAGLPGLKLAGLQELQALKNLDDLAMVNQLRSHLFDADAPTPSIEALLHAFLPPRFIDHSHADAILTLSNQTNGAQLLRQALGDQVIILPYVHPGFALAKAAAEAFAAQPTAHGMVLMQHGLITWGEEARTSYDRHIELVTLAENAIQKQIGTPPTLPKIDLQEAKKRYRAIAPQLRGGLSIPSQQPGRPRKRFILRPLIQPESLAMVGDEQSQEQLLTPPLTSDHLIRTKPLGVWIENSRLIPLALSAYREAYLAYVNRYARPDQTPYDSSPRVLFLPGIGAVCAGESADKATVVRDITRQTIQVKSQIAAMGTYKGLSESQLFEMEYHPLQQAKMERQSSPALEGSVAVITGAAGAIGAGICRELLQQGCHVAATDLAGEPLNALVAELAADHPGRVVAVAMDVTSPEGVHEAFGQIIDTWGGVDLVVINAGLAHVSSLEEMSMEAFQRLQRVNVEGTLNLFSETGRLLKKQGSGGDVVLISTKNVFAPGANFGAYSATKAAAHQLARIASLEMAAMDVRVNMVAPDAVFSEGSRKSGLWAEVGPDRMKARGLDEAGLEAYYQNRNLLKSAVTARHVANAVLYFATRQSPTTGATLPVDGGLPDATPR